MMTIKELKLSLVENKEAVLQYLLKNTENDHFLFDEIVLLNSRNQDLLKLISQGVISTFEINIEQNKIRGSIIHLLNQLQSSDNNFSHNEIELEVAVYSNIENQVTANLFGEEIGVLDLEELMEENSQNLQDNIWRMNSLLEQLSTDIESSTEKLTRLNQSNNGNRVLQKRIINEAAQTMETYSHDMNSEIPIFKDLTSINIKCSMTYIQKVYEYGLETTQDEIDSFEKALCTLYETTISSRTSLQQFYESINNLLIMTTVLGKAKQKAVSSLSTLFIAYDDYIKNLKALIQHTGYIKKELFL